MLSISIAINFLQPFIGDRMIEWKNAHQVVESTCQQVVDCLSLNQGNIQRLYDNHRSFLIHLYVLKCRDIYNLIMMNWVQIVRHCHRQDCCVKL